MSPSWSTASDTPLGRTVASVVQAGAGLAGFGDELATVSEDVGRSTQALLAIIEEIDALVHRCREAGALPEALAQQLSDRTLAAFEACDFQDLTGQRLAGVRRGLKDLDRRIARLQALAALPPAEPEADPSAPSLENGPRLASDRGHLTQADVDRLLA